MKTIQFPSVYAAQYPNEVWMSVQIRLDVPMVQRGQWSLSKLHFLTVMVDMHTGYIVGIDPGFNNFGSCKQAIGALQNALASSAADFGCVILPRKIVVEHGRGFRTSDFAKTCNHFGIHMVSTPSLSNSRTCSRVIRWFQQEIKTPMTTQELATWVADKLNAYLDEYDIQLRGTPRGLWSDILIKRSVSPLVKGKLERKLVSMRRQDERDMKLKIDALFQTYSGKLKFQLPSTCSDE